MSINPIGFLAGTPILTSTGIKRIVDVKPGDIIRSGPDAEHDDHDPPRWWERN